MVETCSSDEERVYYAVEGTYGVTPANPTMLSVPADSIEPTVDPGLIRLGGGRRHAGDQERA
jgi:hypothetical protein